MHNMRRNRWIEFEGQRMILTDWAEKLGMPVHVLYKRLATHGWSTERAIATPYAYRPTLKGNP
jgi:hypothetical protein